LNSWQRTAGVRFFHRQGIRFTGIAGCFAPASFLAPDWEGYRKGGSKGTGLSGRVCLLHCGRQVLADFVAKVEKRGAAKIDARASVRRNRSSQASPGSWGSPWWRERSVEWTPMCFFEGHPYGLGKFGAIEPADFCNNIGPYGTLDGGEPAISGCSETCRRATTNAPLPARRR
jgi:hypothetical protein